MERNITIVDESNKVTGSARRIDAHNKGFWHRIAVVHIFNPQGQIFIQKRSPHADTSPNMWDHSAAGHVDEGEEPEDAAKRELYEELGVKADRLTFISLYKTQRVEKDKTFNRFWYVYKYIFDGEMKLEKSEVSTGKFVDVGWLKKDIKERSDLYTDGLKASFDVYLESLAAN